MTKNVNLFLPSAFVSFVFLTTPEIWGTDENPVKANPDEPDKQGRVLLNQEDFDQQYCLAQMKFHTIYATRQGIFRNPLQAFERFQQLASTGKIVASIIVGWMYRDGFGVEKDEKQAFTILKEAAEHGYAVAQNSLGIMYGTGTDVSQTVFVIAHLPFYGGLPFFQRKG